MSQLCERFDDASISQLIPKNALNLVSAFNSGHLNGSKRCETLAKLLVLEDIVEDVYKRELLLNAIPDEKINEFETRLENSVEKIRELEWLDSSTRRKFLGFFGMSSNEQRVEGFSLSNFVDPNRGLYPHQKKAAVDVVKHLYDGDGRVLLHLPTGVGKTRTAMSIISTHLRLSGMGVVIWLAQTQELLEQAAHEFEMTWEAVGDRTLKCLRFWSNQDSCLLEDVTDGIVFAGLSKLHSYGKNRELVWKLGDKTIMVVFDEAHQIVAPTYHDLVDTLVSRNPRTPLLGLSATPGRTWNEPDLDKSVSEYFYRNKVTLDFGDSVNPIEHLTNQGYLARVQFSVLESNIELQLSNNEIRRLNYSTDISEELAIRIGDDEQRNAQIIKCLLDIYRRHHRSLVFAASVSNAILLSSVCRALGLETDIVTSKTEKKEREVVIKKFKRSGGVNRLLINYGVLTTGFDAPNATAVLIARPTKSLVLYSQMVGRVIRGPKAGGEKECEVVTVVDTSLPGFGDVAEAFLNWEDVWNPQT